MTETGAQDAIFLRLDQKVEKTLPKCGNCAQTTFLALQEEFDLGGEEILKALTPFPGIALRGETCGAISAGLMVLGMVDGRDKENLENWNQYIKSLPPARRFCRRFEDAVGSTMCGAIIESNFGRPFDLADPVEAMQWFECGALEKCGQVIKNGVRLVAEILLANDKRAAQT